MRSVKYELVDTDDSAGLRDQIIEAVVSDYRALYGPINLNDYLADKKSPSLIDFWLKALSFGFVFSNQNSIENEFLAYLGKKTIWQKCYENLDDKFKAVVDERSFCQFLIALNRDVQKKTDEQKQKIILNLAEKKADASALMPIAQKWSQGFSPDKDQLQFKCEIFGISVPHPPKDSLKLGFAVDPNFEVMDCNDRTEFLDNIIRFYEDKVGSAQAKRFLAIGDNGNYFNNVFGKLLTCLKQDKIDTVVEFLNDTYDLNNFAEIKSRFTELKKLADKIGEPKLVNNWSDYRSDFNGTIESWYSNRISKQQTALEQLDGKIDTKTGKVAGGLRELLGNIANALPENSPIKEGTLAETIAFLSSHGERIDRKFTDKLESFLSTLRENLNEWSQNNKGYSLPAGWQQKLSKRIQSSPLFFGENKHTLWGQLINLKSLIKEEFAKLEAISQEKFQDYDITDRQVDALAQLAQRIRSDGDPEVIQRLSDIESELQVNFKDRSERARYFVSGFERAKFTQLEIKNRIRVSRLVELARLGERYQEAKRTPQDGHILRDTVQLSKIVVSALVRGSNKESEVTLMHSNLNGYASLISRREFIARSTVQAVNGGQVSLGIRNNRYVYAFLPNKFTAHTNAQLFGKTYNFTRADLKSKESLAPVLGVRSSKYQVQFLDWFMGYHKRKKTELGAGGAFCIAERTIKLDWSGEEPRIAEVSNPRIFVSQPFEIKPKSRGTLTTKNRFIGVDIGEYGLAWSLIEVNDTQVTQLESGFIADPQQQILKDTVKKLREKQVRATFNSPDTRVARIRESLIGTYRNRLEDLAMHKNARLSFEYEVSAFESGGARISKIYHSIKQREVRGNDIENIMAWGGVDMGKRKRPFRSDEFSYATEISAAGTSQTCSRCKRWASLAIDNNNGYELKEYEDKLFKTKIADGEVRLLTKKDTSKTVKGKELKGLIYKAMRPNDDGLGMEIVKRRTNWGQLSKYFGAGKPRGNIAIFVCPYTDCHHVSDADLQAAFNIAMRGYGEWKSEGKVSKVQDFVELARGLTFSPVPLRLNSDKKRQGLVWTTARTTPANPVH